MKRYTVLYHISFWVLYVLVFTIIHASYKENYREALIIELVRLPTSLLVVYFNYFVLFPKLLNGNRYVQYVLYSLLTLCIGGFIQRLINYEVLSFLLPGMKDLGKWQFYKFLKAFSFLALPLITCIGISVVWRYARLQERTQRLEKEKLQSELKYLKSQINPHFLFNTLNTIYGLALENSRKTAQLILELSDFLNFSLYESSKEKIPLQKEIDLINNFVSLEESRFRDRVKVHMEIENKNLDKAYIPPLILVPFVENAFKHSLKEETKVASITIHLKVTNNHLIFEVQNSKPEITESLKVNSGVGLENICKRLSILYKDNHELQINNHARMYSVILKINL